jgi:hypothetical protein
MSSAWLDNGRPAKDASRLPRTVVAMSPSTRFGLAFLLAVACGAAASAAPPAAVRHSPMADRANTAPVQVGGRVPREPALFHGIPAAPLRKSEAQPAPSVPSDLFSNPLRRHRMAMPSIPSNDDLEFAF